MIDRATVEKIMEAANIVDVVSEFVTLRKSGANYKGLCPFHEEKTPSFHVSPARGICHCFGCGKGGNAVSFIMEHEQMTYPEALRWLAAKYHIEIHERELSDEEKKEQSERESMFIVNEWASGYFEDILHNNVDGVAVGMQYFRSRGFRDDIIKKFRLGFDLNNRSALASTAVSKGYNPDYLVKTGLCYKTERGDLIDRFAGRVIFPWVGISGKTVGFGGRLLDSRTKGVNQKYVNSPDSEIYHKDRELYGIYQAKKAIAKEDRVYMVEGYTDVISMHQCGIENVVANSGTALSTHQIHMLHRFTSNITLLYDGDEAGIHAAMRGTDMLLSEGMNLKVLLLPDGDDPDSFARKHTASDFRKYIEDHQTDFIQFKTSLMLDGQTDPLKRSEAINSVVKSISLVSNQILRDTYIHDCSVKLGINETTLINTMNKFIRSVREDKPALLRDESLSDAAQKQEMVSITAKQVSGVEQMLIGAVIRHGEEVIYDNVESEDGSVVSLNVAQYIDYNLGVDGLSFSNPLYARILSEAVAHSGDKGFVAEQYFIHHDDIEISKIAASLSIDELQFMAKESTDDEPKSEKELQIEEEDRITNLRNQVEHLLNDFRMDYLDKRLRQLQTDITASVNNADRMRELMKEYQEVHKLRGQLAKVLGKNIVV